MPSEYAYGADLTDEVFGRLTVVCLTPYNGHSKKWACLCECGRFKLVATEKLTSGQTRSCGCLRSETTAETNRKEKTTHGMSGTTYYAVWSTMIARCERANNASFPSYGARGIKVCGRWRDSFEAFAADMGPRPEGHEIDRKDTNGDYEPGNCRWVTSATNTRNRRVTPKYEHDGRSQSLGDWADESGIPYRTLKERIRHGWSVGRAVTEPVKESV